MATTLLRIATAGSVDDGKSTLIGRILHDTGSLPTDHLAAVTDGDGDVDLAALSDGLRAEREQGITIDVAYRFFSTPTRSYVLADTPGHERYTRNMFTGASNAHVAILLVEQNFRFASTVADRYYVMEHGQIIDSFATSELEGRMERLHEVLGV